MNAFIQYEFNRRTVARADATDIWRVQNIDPAKRLGYKRPRRIRQLIKRMSDEGEPRLYDADRSGEAPMRRTVRRIEKCPAICGSWDRQATRFWAPWALKRVQLGTGRYDGGTGVFLAGSCYRFQPTPTSEAAQ